VSRLPRTTMRIPSIIFLVFLFAGSSVASDLKITDATNTVIVVHEAFIDYGGLMGDKEPDGLRLYQGEAIVTAKWSNIQSVTITGKTTAPAENRLRADIVPKKGSKISTTLLSKGRMKLSGKTDLGDYAIDLEKVRVIEPLQQP
jgi:hypothetical protein